MIASGSLDSLEEGLPGEQRLDEERLKGITYRAKGTDWYVLSGRSGGKIVYTKTFLRKGQFVGFELTYPMSAAARYKPILERIQKCFSPGPPPY